MDAFMAWLQQLEFTNLIDLIIMVVSALLCITFHEAGHAWMAYCLGDQTAKQMGRLSLNPLRHLDLMGLVMIAIFRFGWAKPVPVDMHAFRHPKWGMALTALAGPAANVILTFFALLLRSIAYYFYFNGANRQVLSIVMLFLEYTALISAGLAVFNLIPISPLDGSKFFFSVLPERWYFKLMQYEKYGAVILVILLISGAIDTPLLAGRNWLIESLHHICSWPYTLLHSLLH